MRWALRLSDSDDAAAEADVDEESVEEM